MKTQAIARLQETALTLGQVNRALKAKGYPDEMVKGKGYFYFIGKDADNWRAPSIYVYALNQMPLEKWIEAYEGLREENDEELQAKKNAERYEQRKDRHGNQR